jgi:hypothetical protein
MMIETAQNPTDGIAELGLLRLLLDDGRIDPDNLDWSVILPAAREHHVLLRLAAWFERRHESPPAPIAASIEEARRRLNCVIALVARVEERCIRREVDHVFLKLAQQYPDVGRDLDLLVPGSETDIDPALFDREPRTPTRTHLRGRFSATSYHAIPECDATLAVHHGRVGRLGEHERYARQLLRRQRRVCIGAISWTAPPAEDALLLQVLDRLYGRPMLRLRDVHWTIATLREDKLDWDYLIGAARATGLIAGLTCYLDYAEQIHQQLFARPLIRGDVRDRLAGGDWGRVSFEGGSYRFPAARVTGRLYFNEFCADVATGNWEAATRLFFLPVAAAAAVTRRLTQQGPSRSLTNA